LDFYVENIVKPKCRKENRDIFYIRYVDDFVFLAEEKEDSLNFQELIDNLFSIECLTDRQKDYIRLYYLESYTFEKIGQKYGITREAVRQGLNKAIETIKQYV
jgi:RNA polymerase sigma factor (sigma-70 family)